MPPQMFSQCAFSLDCYHFRSEHSSERIREPSTDFVSRFRRQHGRNAAWRGMPMELNVHRSGSGNRRWSPTALTEFATLLFGALPEFQLSALRFFVQSAGPLRWSSGCSLPPCQVVPPAVRAHRLPRKSPCCRPPAPDAQRPRVPGIDP